MSDKTHIERAHELLLELAKSGSVVLQYPDTPPNSANYSRGDEHGDYLTKIIEKVAKAYRAAAQ